MAQCLTPYHLKDQDIDVPCGKCPHCASRRVSAWSFRLAQQAEVSTSAYFVTLTYNTMHLPLTDRGFMSLEKSDLQNFFKRLRKLNKNVKLKYYAVGEYGSKYRRPHYHIILFNCNVHTIEEAWSISGCQIGEIFVGSVTASSVGYTLKYVSKPAWRPMHQNDDRSPQFSLMSKGLGKSYVVPETIAWHNADLNRMYVHVEFNKKASMPRYIKNLIYDDQQRDKVHHATLDLLRINQLKDKRTEYQKSSSKLSLFKKQIKNSVYGNF